MVQNVDIFTVENVQKFDIFHPTSMDKDKDKSYTYDEALNVIGMLYYDYVGLLVKKLLNFKMKKVS